MKTIDKFLGKEKEPDSSVEETRPEAMTLEEMAVKVQERKILGTERKVDMNIIMFVALCLCGLVIINVVLYFLIGESKTNTLNPVPEHQDARNLLKERREERAASLASAEAEIETVVEQVMDDRPIAEMQQAEEPMESIEVTASTVGGTANLQDELASPETAAIGNSVVENVELSVESPVESPEVESSAQTLDESAAEEMQEQIQEETTVAPYPIGKTTQLNTVSTESEEIPFDLVISVGSTINDWAGAWSAQNVDKYLSYYADTFVSEAGMNIEEWRAHRAIRLTKPEWISIGIDKLKINMIDGGAKAEFVQEYNASNYSDKELKKMIFRKVNDEWRIFDERATPVK